jgi:hypothetical protein
MSDMTQRVARAIAVKVINHDQSFASLEDIARTAIEAMHRPTEAMLDAARDWSIKKYGRAVGNDGTSGCWGAMIDEALK